MHAAELQRRELTHVRAETCLPEEHRARRIELDPQCDREEERQCQQQAGRCDDDVERALDQPRRGREAGRREPDECQRLDRMHLDPRSDELEQPRHDVDLHVERPERADQLERLALRRTGEGDHDAFDVEQVHELGEPVGPAEHGDVRQVAAQLLRLVVDEADEVEPVLRMLQELAAYELPDVTCADDDRVLEVRDAAAARRPRERPRGSHEDHGEHPEGSQLRELRIGEPGRQRAEREQPGSDRDQVEHADHVVDRRRVGPALVAFVEAVQLREDDPRGQRQEEH